MQQLTVKAADQRGGYSTVIVSISIPRDRGFPQFGGPYSRLLSENAAVNSSVITVKAVDSDTKVSTPLQGTPW